MQHRLRSSILIWFFIEIANPSGTRNHNGICMILYVFWLTVCGLRRGCQTRQLGIWGRMLGGRMLREQLQSQSLSKSFNIDPPYGYGSIPIDTFLVGWTSIYQLFWGSLGTRVFDPSPYCESFWSGCRARFLIRALGWPVAEAPWDENHRPPFPTDSHWFPLIGSWELWKWYTKPTLLFIFKGTSSASSLIESDRDTIEFDGPVTFAAELSRHICCGHRCGHNIGSMR